MLFAFCGGALLRRGGGGRFIVALLRKKFFPNFTRPFEKVYKFEAHGFGGIFCACLLRFML